MNRTELKKLTNDLLCEKKCKLYNCSAYVLDSVEDNQFLVLQSYTTRVGIADFDTNTFYLFGYYSATTTQHAHKFIKWLRENYSKDFELVRLEPYSNTPKKYAKKLYDEDFSSLINISL